MARWLFANLCVTTCTRGIVRHYFYNTKIINYILYVYGFAAQSSITSYVSSQRKENKYHFCFAFKFTNNGQNK